MKAAAVLLLSVTLGAIGIATACSSSDSGGGSTSGTTTSTGTPCYENPWECPTGQVCWVTSEKVFKCLNSGKGNAGDACMGYYDTPECDDGLTCFAVQNYPHVCTPFCSTTDPAHACPNKAVCMKLTSQDDPNASYFACVPEATDGGAGGGGAGGATTTTTSSTGGAGGIGGAGGAPDGG